MAGYGVQGVTVARAAIALCHGFCISQQPFHHMEMKPTFKL